MEDVLNIWDQHVTNSSVRNTTWAQDWTQVYDAVRWIQLVMATLSIFGSGFIIRCVVSQRLSITPELYPLLWLSLSDLLLSLCWLVGAAVFSEKCTVLNSHCYHLHTVEQVLFMASFFYTLNYVWNLFTNIREKYHCCLTGYTGQFSNRVSVAGKMTAVISGLLPVLLMTPVFIQSELNQCQTNSSEPYRCLLMNTGVLFMTSQQQHPIRACRLLHTYSSSTFLCTFIITLLGIMVLMCKSGRMLRRVVSCGGYMGRQQRALFREMDRRMVLYPLVFFCCWAPAVTLAALRLVLPSATLGSTGVGLYITQALMSGSQGFLNCLAYGCCGSKVCGSGRTVFYRDSNTQTPLLRSQKHQGYKSLCTTR